MSPQAQADDSAVAHPTRVVEALEFTRRQMGRFRLQMAWIVAASTMTAMAVVVVVLDVSWVLPARARSIGLVALVLSGLGIAARPFLSRRRPFGRDQAASEVESAFPELGQRVRTTLEYSRPGPDTAPASPSMVGALVADTERRSDGLEFSEVVPWARLGRRMLALSVAYLAIVIALIYDPTLRIAARRVFLQPVHYTTLAVEPGDRTLPQGSKFTLRATFAGRPVASAEWHRRPVGGRGPWTSATLGPTSSGRPLVGTAEAVVEDCRADFEYQVVAGEVQSDTYRVTVTHPLALKSLEATIRPPAYTRLPPSTVKEGNFRVPEGSKVRLRIALDRPPASARLAWAPEGSKSPRTLPIAVDGTGLDAELPTIEGDVRYEILATAADGMKLDPARYLIQVTPDEKPTIRFLKPAEACSATPTTEVPLKVAASDDHGVARVGMVYQVGDGPEQSLYLDGPAGSPPTVEALAMLYLEEHGLTSPGSVTYRAFVEDNRSPEPRRASTELRFIDIVPYKQAFQLADGGGRPGGTSATLEELIDRQRRALNRAFAHAEDRPVEEKVADRLSKEEAELALVAGDFAQKLASEFGPISPLDDASRAMGQATASLDSKDLASAIPLEKSGLASLIKARKDLRKLLTAKSSSGLCRNIDRAQQQTLRTPPAADKPKEAELAKLERELKKLARDQESFAEEVDPRGASGAQPPLQDGTKPGPGSKAPPSERQGAASREADRLAALARSDPSLTDLAHSRMDEATKAVKQAEAEFKDGRPPEAASTARSAADQLARLADQVGALQAKELQARIARARDLARETARGERELAGAKNPARGPDAETTQRGLAEGARTLGDVLKRLMADAQEEDRTLGRAVDRANRANSPAEIERSMRRASAAISSGDGEGLAHAMVEAASKLDALARDLESARREFMQPKLQQLLAVERKAAEVLKALDSASNEAQKAEAEKALADLARLADALKAGDQPLRRATDALRQAADGSTDGWLAPGKVGGRVGLFTPPISRVNAARDVSRALQAEIRELILGEALVDRDGAVPPGYKEKVEDYFRVLSEDLR